MKYSKEELLGMINGFFNDNPMICNTPTAEVRGLIAQYLADRIQKPVGLSLSDCNKIVGIVSDLLSPLLTQKGREYMAELIHAEMKEGE